MNRRWQLVLTGVVAVILATISLVAAVQLLKHPVDIKPPDQTSLLVVPVGVAGDEASLPDESALSALIEDLRRSLNIEYSIAKPYILPKTLLNRETGQLRVDLALSDIAQRYRRSGYFRVLGVTAKDITIPNYNFLFGLADTRGFACMMSVHRLSWGADEELTRERTAKIALHEVGHTLGRGHTPDIESVMVYSDSLSGLDESGSRFTALDVSIILAKIPELADEVIAAEPTGTDE